MPSRSLDWEPGAGGKGPLLRGAGGGRRACALLFAAALGASCAKAPEGYFPLEAGWQWQYSVRLVTGDGAREGKYIVSNLEPCLLGGRLAVPRRTPAGATYFYLEDPSGVHRLGEGAPGALPTLYPVPQPVLRYPLAPGSSWQGGARTSVLEVTARALRELHRIEAEVPVVYTVESVSDTVSVPAGTYRRCLRIAGRGSTLAEALSEGGLAEVRLESTAWYAPGVGLVRAIRRETSSSAALPAGQVELRLERLRRG